MKRVRRKDLKISKLISLV